MKYRESTKNIPDRVLLSPGETCYLESGTYQIESQIGEGGFGQVYKVINSDNQVFALKILKLWEVLPREFELLTKRFLREYEVGQLNSLYIIRTYYIGYVNGNPYILMEYCPNGSLTDNLELFDNPNTALDFSKKILQGLHAMHQHNIIHRDIKPANILFNDQDDPKLVDFGISGFLNNRMTRLNVFGRIKSTDLKGLGISKGFSPPEMFTNRKLFKFTLPTMDIYSFACTLFYGLTKGEYPFGKLDNDRDFDAHFFPNQKSDFIDFSSLPLPYQNSFWKEIISKCLRNDSSMRYQTAIELINDLNSFDSYGLSNFSKKSENLLVTLTYDGKLTDTLNLNELSIIKGKNHLAIGRENNSNHINDITIASEMSKFISRKHATLEKHKSHWYVRDGQYDLDSNEFWSYSANGTYYNQNLLRFQEYKKLNVNDEIRIGEVTLKFKNSDI